MSVMREHCTADMQLLLRVLYEIMKILEFDFRSLSEIAEYADIIQVGNISSSFPAQNKTTLYYHIQEESSKCFGLLVLGLRHSKHDLSYFEEKLCLAFDRACFERIQWNKNKDGLYFEIVERRTILVNGANTLISFEHVFNDGSDTAKNIKAVSHYTTTKAAEKIISNQMIKAKSLSRYNSEAGFSYNENSRRLAFYTSFSQNTISSEEMWNRFGDKHGGCKIVFCFSHSFWNAFFPTQPLQAYDQDENEYFISTKRGFANPRCIPDVWTETHFCYAEYSSVPKNNSALEIHETWPQDFTIVDNIGRWVWSKYDYQQEVRIVLLLSSTKEVEIPFIKEIFLPFRINQMEKVIVTIGNRAKKRQRENILALGKKCEWIEVVEEP